MLERCKGDVKISKSLSTLSGINAKPDRQKKKVARILTMIKICNPFSILLYPSRLLVILSLGRCGM